MNNPHQIHEMIQKIPTEKFKFIIEKASIAMVFILGLWFVVLVPLGPHLTLLPGDLADSRVNNYLLEHFYRWVSGLDKNFWSTAFFYPFPLTIAFSDNFWGSGPFYTVFRWLGQDRESAFQTWYILGFFLNYAAAVYALSRLRLKPLALAAGAFFFTFGLPLLAQDTHLQLYYRFGIPLACLFITQMLAAPRLCNIALVLFWTVWQFYLSIYTGLFLSFLLVSIFLLLPFFASSKSLSAMLLFWPRQAKLAWLRASHSERILVPILCISFTFALGALFWPYYQVTRLYGFSRSWPEVARMLPVWRSYLLADRSVLWSPISNLILPSKVPMRSEHQLFPGVFALILGMVGLFHVKSSENRKLVMLYFWAALFLIGITLSNKDFSLYQWIWQIPGMDSLRSVTRIILILMWPLAVIIAYGCDRLLTYTGRTSVLLSASALILVSLMIVDSTLFEHITYNKAASQARITVLASELPKSLPSQPILIFSNKDEDPWIVTEIDAMLLSQSLNIPVMNGYSGNLPTGYGPTLQCSSLPDRILSYQNFLKDPAPSAYFNLLSRAVPIGFSDCDPSWWTKAPSRSTSTGPLPAEIFSGLRIQIVSLKLNNTGLHAQLEIANNSSKILPAHSSSDNDFVIAWRFINIENQRPLTNFTDRQEISWDILPGAKTPLTLRVTAPAQSGQYQLEVTAIQEGVARFDEKGMPIARTDQTLKIDGAALSLMPTQKP